MITSLSTTKIDLPEGMLPLWDAPRVVLFDGVCNLCNGSVQFIIDRDPEVKFLFAPLQSEIGQQLLQDHGLPANELNSIVLIEKGSVFTKSTAALRIARQLKGGWPACYAFIVVPRLLRDGAYSLIAKNRYRWFGKEQACRVPTPELKARFLEKETGSAH